MQDHLPKSSDARQYGQIGQEQSDVDSASGPSSNDGVFARPNGRQHSDVDKASPYRTARAYMQILGLLSRQHWVSASQVQARLEEAGWCYGKRAVEKMLKSLAEEHPGVERDDSVKPYLYRWCSDLHLPWNPELSDREALTLLLAAEHLRQLLPSEVQQWLDGRFREARSRLDPVRGVQPFNTWSQKVAVVNLLPPMMPPHISQEVYQNVSQALLKDLWLNVDYRNADGQLKQNRRVMPLALVRQGERLFLVCQFDGFQDIRHLALHRMVAAEATPHPFVRPIEFSLKQYIQSGAFGFGGGGTVRLTLKVKPYIADLLTETPLSADQQITRGSSSESDVVVSLTVPCSEQIRWWVRMHGESIHVLEPDGFMAMRDTSVRASSASQKLSIT